MLVKTGSIVKAGDRLTSGSLNLQDQLKYKGAEETARYIMNDVLAVYAAQGHEISSKHLEIIVRQMFSRVKIEDQGDSKEYNDEEIVSLAAVTAENEKLVREGKTPITFKRLLLGITRVSIWSDSFLSAASFQDTTRVLINAAINGRVDRLHGLKENVIIGRKIPVGTGKHPIESMDPAEAAAREEARERGEEYVPESAEVEAEVENA
jgi:DNA-directed RNA polymerase subunit beta'